MPIIKHTAAPAQPTTGFRVEERIYDTRSVPDSDGITNVDLTAKTVDAADDRDRGWLALQKAVRANPDRYRSGAGIRLVLLGGDR